jgi:hypothetical protein
MESASSKSLQQIQPCRIKDEPTITWGVKYDTRLFGMMDIKTRKVEGFDIDLRRFLLYILTTLLQAAMEEIVRRTFFLTST